MPSTTSRRTLLASAALVAPATLLPTIAAVAGGQDPDPHPAWLVEWRATRAALFPPGGDDVEDDDPDWLRFVELERLIALTPARTLAGVRAQLALLHHAVSENGVPNGDDVTGLENAIASLDRLAGEARDA